jgi:Gly-Xaa carboxypeptidase
VLAFGQDEEISGPRGANNIGKYLEQRYGRNGISMIVDEGGMSLETVYGKEFALPGIAEKGYLVSSYFQCNHIFYSNSIE